MLMKKKHNYTFLVMLLLLAVSIGYSALTVNLKIQGVTRLSGNTWDVHLENIDNIDSKGATVNSEPVINNNILTFNVTLAKPGDYYEFTVDVKNDGGIDA